MKKVNILKSTTILMLVGGLAASVAFTSCDNFLTASNFKAQLEADIAYANASPCEIRVDCDTESGEITSSKILSKKLTDEFTVEFKLASGSSFTGWKAYSKSSDGTLTELSSDYIKFISYDTESIDGIYRAQVKFLQAAENIVIKPVCLTIPCVKSVYPASSDTSYANAPVTIAFNMPMDENYFQYDEGFISIKDGISDVSDLFEPPSFNENKTELTLRPSGVKLYEHILSKNTAYLDLAITLSEKIKVTKEISGKAYTLSLKQDGNSSCVVRYLPEVESVNPTKYDFFASVTELQFDQEGNFVTTSQSPLSDDEKFTQEEIALQGNFSDEEYKAKILQNRTNGTVYIYGRYYDADSGVNAVRITRQRTNSKDGTAVSENTVTNPLYTKTSEDAEFFTKDGYTSFCIKYEIPDDEEKSDIGDGAILVKMSVLDAAGNETEAESFTVIKDAYVDLSGAVVTNVPDSDEQYLNSSNNKVTDMWNYNRFSSAEEFCDYFEANSKQVKLTFSNFNFPVYGELNTKICLIENVYLEYESKSGKTKQKMDWNEERSLWSTDLNVDYLNNLDFTIYIQDEFGNTGTRNYKMPEPVIHYIGWTEWGYYNRACTSNNIVYYGYRNPSSNQTGNSWASRDLDQYTFCDGNIVKFITGKDSENKLVGDIIRVSESSLINSKDFVDFSGLTDIEINDSVLTVNLTDNVWDLYSSINCELSYKWFTDEGDNIEKLIDYISGKGNAERKLLDKIVNNGQNISFDLGYDISSYFFQVKVVLLGTQKDSDIPAKYEKTYNIKYEAEDTYPPNLECSDMLRTSDMNELYGTEENWSEDYIVVTAKDLYMGTGDDSDKIYSSGLKCFELYVNGEKTAVFKPEELKQVSANSYVLPLYGRFVDYDNEKAVFKIIAYDNNNNAVEREITKNSETVYYKHGYGDFIDLTCLNGICKFRLRHYDYDHAKVHLYKWEDNQWVLTDSFRPVNESAYVYNELLPFNTIKLSSDGFYKLLSEYTYYENGYYESITHEYYERIYWYFNSPCILSTLTKSSGSYDFILKNGSSISSVVVSSDQPVFVYTLVTVKDYASCSTWDTATWESKFLKHAGDTVLDFSPGDHSPKRYTIPLDSIHDGECYVVIAHFADGSTAMSEVMQR